MKKVSWARLRGRARTNPVSRGLLFHLMSSESLLDVLEAEPHSGGRFSGSLEHRDWQVGRDPDRLPQKLWAEATKLIMSKIPEWFCCSWSRRPSLGPWGLSLHFTGKEAEAWRSWFSPCRTGVTGSMWCGWSYGEPRRRLLQGTPSIGWFSVGRVSWVSWHWWQTMRQLGSSMKVGHSGDKFPESLRLNMD